jgi:hypothetical protein
VKRRSLPQVTEKLPKFLEKRFHFGFLWLSYLNDECSNDSWVCVGAVAEGCFTVLDGEMRGSGD